MTESHHTPVLVVEDSDEDWDTICQAARQGGYEARLQRVLDGDACMSLLHECSNGRDRASTPPLPALVILDLNLPGTDGRDVLVAIKGDQHLKALPVVVCSTSSSPRDIAFCYAAGVNAFHVKPVHYNDHLQVVRDLLDYWLARARLPERAAVS
jgi:CheY-like chemotaxis protein